MKFWRKLGVTFAVSATAFLRTGAVQAGSEEGCDLKPFYSATGWHQAANGWLNATQCGWHYRVDYWGIYNNRQYVTEAVFEWWVEPHYCEPRIAPGIDGLGATVYFVPQLAQTTCYVRWDSKIINNGRVVGEMRISPYGYNKAGREVYVRESITAGSTWYRVGN